MPLVFRGLLGQAEPVPRKTISGYLRSERGRRSTVNGATSEVLRMARLGDFMHRL